MKPRRDAVLVGLCAAAVLLCSACAETNEAQESAPFQPVYFDQILEEEGEVLDALQLTGSDMEVLDHYRVRLTQKKAEICGYKFTIDLLFDDLLFNGDGEDFLYGFRYTRPVDDLSREECYELLLDIFTMFNESYGTPKTAPMEGRIQDWSGAGVADFDPERVAFERFIVPGSWPVPEQWLSEMPDLEEEDVILRVQMKYEPDDRYEGGGPHIVLDFDLRVHKMVSYEREHGIAI